MLSERDRQVIWNVHDGVLCFQRETDKSYGMYMRAYEEAKGQREIELMCLYEISKFVVYVFV